MTKSKNNYWKRFWSKNLISAGDDDQSQVLRVRDNKPIDKNKWDFTLKNVEQHLKLRTEDHLLDLCCGNGLFTSAFSSKVKSITAVDINSSLLERLQSKNLENVELVNADIRDYPLSKTFDKVLWYAGIQYLDESDIVKMIFNLRNSLKNKGLIMVGDIPNKSKLWDYFNTAERKMTYFNGIMNNQPLVGTWLEKSWLENLFYSADFKKVEIVNQHPNLIYSDFRFDLIAEI